MLARLFSQGVVVGGFLKEIKEARVRDGLGSAFLHAGRGSRPALGVPETEGLGRGWALRGGPHP